MGYEGYDIYWLYDFASLVCLISFLGWIAVLGDGTYFLFPSRARNCSSDDFPIPKTSDSLVPCCPSLV